MRGSRKEEWLTSFDDLVDWLETGGAIDARQAKHLRAEGAKAPEKAKDLWARAIQLRDALARVLLAKAAERAADASDLAVIDAEYARTAPCARLAPTKDGFRWDIK